MGLKPDHWIRKMAREQRMIEPFVLEQVREGVISYGVSSYGYDIRVADEFKIFTNVYSAVVDPKHFDTRSMVDFKGEVCVIPPNSFALARTIEYFRIPRKVLTICLGKSTYARCFRGDTQVALVDGTTPSLEDMANRAEKGERFLGYSMGELGRVIVTLLEQPRYTGRDSLVEIMLDNDQYIRCTPDHQFIDRAGRLVQADDLRPGDALMPLDRSAHQGSEVVYQPLTGDLIPTQKMVDGWHLRRQKNEGLLAMLQHNGGSKSLETNTQNLVPMHAGDDVRNHKIKQIRDLPGTHDVYCLTVPEAGNFGLQAGVFVKNCGIIVNVTPFEPEWQGYVTLEISNTTPLPARIYANEGIAQVLFFEADEECDQSYADKKGKYQNQQAIVLPKL